MAETRNVSRTTVSKANTYKLGLESGLIFKRSLSIHTRVVTLYSAFPFIFVYEFKLTSLENVNKHLDDKRF